MVMKVSLRTLLHNDPLARFDRAIASSEVYDRLAEFLPPSPSPQIIGALWPFASDQPWKYWDSTTVKVALSLLEQDKARTVAAIRNRGVALNRGIENLFRPSPVVFFEESLDHTQSRGLIRLATEFLPEYLRWAEHIFGNLIEVYWSVCKRGGVDGKFDLRGATHSLSQKGLNHLLNGYEDAVRNAIAHGDFTLTGLTIDFGSINPVQYSSPDFLRLFDELCRTCNALCLGLMLFWGRNTPGAQLQGSIPLAVVTRFAAGGLNRTGLKLLGAVESHTPLAGRQLHAAVQMAMRSRTQVLGECARVATHLLEAGAEGYSRFLIEIDHGEQVSSLVIVLPGKLKELLDNDAPIELLPQTFAETQLLLFNEGQLKTRVRTWQTILSAGIKKVRLDTLKNWRDHGLWIGKGRYHLREVKNLSVQGIARIHIRAVLKNPADADDKQAVREIIYELVKAARNRFVRSRGKLLDADIPWPKRPKHVFVDLYRVDGTLRWLGGGGWLSGNLVATAERIWGRGDPVLVENAEEIYKGIRIRYTMDSEKAREALNKLVSLMADIYESRRSQA
jgi:hypothetical protein